MRLKLLLLLMLFGISNWMLGQTIPWDSTLLITEVSVPEGQFNNGYVEITNVGDKALDLGDFKFIQPSSGAANANCDWQTGRWTYGSIHYMWLPESHHKMLQPGESFVFTIALDFGLNGYNLGLEDFAYADRAKNHNIYPLADFIAHRDERGDLWEQYGIENGGPVKDSVTYNEDSTYTFSNYGFTIGRIQLPQNGFAIEQHYIDPETGLEDSIVIDQAKNTFTDNCANEKSWFSVAGVENAMRDGVVFRKSTVSKGQLDWFTYRGLGLEDSEWMALKYPEGWDNWREYWWTVGNHAKNEVWDATTLTPKAGENISVDWAGKKITVPWGVRRLDDIMMRMEHKPGLAWIYLLNGTSADSVYRSAQTGDKLAVYLLGSTFYADTFDIEVSDPLASDNIVVPVAHINTDGGPIVENPQAGKLSWPRITTHAEGTDTITGAGRGLPHDLRIDSLYKYIEKAPNASWEIVTYDGAVRADLKNGDKLKVTAENGAVKEYFLQVRGFEPSDQVYLTSITWPDNTLNAAQKFVYGWTGDTIPGFNQDIYSYRVTLPAGTGSIPALVAKTQNPDANLSVDRATSFDGSIDLRTTTFTVVSESLVDTAVYTVVFEVEVDLSTLQPYTPDPFVSQYVPKSQQNMYAEICNPGNRELDLSYYMFVNGEGLPPEEAIQQFMGSDSATWASRYKKYIPGRKWVSQGDWALAPGTVEPAPDITVDATVDPGDVFVMVCLTNTANLAGLDDPASWDILERADVSFYTVEYVTPTFDTLVWPNNWGEVTGNEAIMPSALGQDAFFMFKILNDSVRNGTKPANDPADFELVEVLSMENYDDKWEPAGPASKITQGDMIERKPEFTIPRNIAYESFGATPEASEWNYSKLQNSNQFLVESLLGDHFFIKPTFYISTVKAIIYKVSPGYSDAETLEGVTTGTTVSDMLSNIYKANEGQTLTVERGGNPVADGDAVLQGDVLVVVSENGENTTKYTISVSDAGLSDDATLSSTVYTVEEDVNAGTGSVAGMDYGTALTAVLDNVTAHDGAVITVVDANDLYIPMKRLNFYNEYVTSTADYDTYLEVVAENTVDKILYQLQPAVEGDTAFITSFIYEVTDEEIIRYIPLGTSFVVFMKNIIASPGATVQVFDKYGYERTSGNIVQDDKVIATSASGEVQTVYYLSLLMGDDMMIQTVPSLAFITSNVYAIDQVATMIDSVVENTTVAEFIANVIPATDATVEVRDADGNVKANDAELAQSDVVLVTSGDGSLFVVYTFGTFKEDVGIQHLLSGTIKLYPNPTRGSLEISGLETGSRIQVFNMLGSKMMELESLDKNQEISLAGKPDGLYYIVISMDNLPIGNYKVIKY